MVMFAPQIPVALYSMDESASQPIVVRSHKVIRQKFRGRKGCRFSQGKVRAKNKISLSRKSGGEGPLGKCDI